MPKSMTQQPRRVSVEVLPVERRPLFVTAYVMPVRKPKPQMVTVRVVSATSFQRGLK